ncbi:hypothetical protein BGZ95_007985 [Linnemannia exigua]|uniref:Uncharacterized protein n=1 Tax=Linnemannia exigua TaxID=604196 RepID=A0AAD4DEK6_9FUNG|nr:hypothetical protein BGZ95_007985 [Linnemannia exigua]
MALYLDESPVGSLRFQFLKVGDRLTMFPKADFFEDVRKSGKTTKSPLFDVALRNHVKLDLPNLSEVVITEAHYRKKLV